jgi:uncharacterized protein (DUF983 family)
MIQHIDHKIDFFKRCISINELMKKGTKLYSILKLKCPRCQTGNLFYNNKLFAFTKILEMPEKCSHCHQDFIIEPGFYSAALWISFPMIMILFIPIILLGLSLDDLHNFFMLLYPIIIVIFFLLQIPIMRISRAILLNMTVDYVEE